MSAESSQGNSIGLGCLFGCLCQVGFIAAGVLTAFSLPGGKLQSVIFMSWGVTQWIALVPLILQQRGKGHSRTVQGLIVTGALGLLLSSACASTLLRR